MDIFLLAVAAVVMIGLGTGMILGVYFFGPSAHLRRIAEDFRALVEDGRANAPKETRPAHILVECRPCGWQGTRPIVQLDACPKCGSANVLPRLPRYS